MNSKIKCTKCGHEFSHLGLQFVPVLSRLGLRKCVKYPECKKWVAVPG